MSDHKVYNTPLLKKIGVKANDKILLLKAPDWLCTLFSSDGYKYDSIPSGKDYSIIWLFENKVIQMERQLKSLSKHIIPNGMIWFSWYKKASKMPTELNEDIIRDTALRLDLVDVKVASVDDQWSALKLVIPIVKRK